MKQYINILLIVTAIFILVPWVFNHINPWVAIVSFLSIIFLVVYKINKQNK